MISATPYFIPPNFASPSHQIRNAGKGACLLSRAGARAIRVSISLRYTRAPKTRDSGNDDTASLRQRQPPLAMELSEAFGSAASASRATSRMRSRFARASARKFSGRRPSVS